jgi:hypothetical protein
MAQYILALLLALASFGQADGTRERTLKGNVPAAGLKSIDVRGKVGSIAITPANGSEIRYSVRLTAKTEWHFFGRKTGRPDLVDLRQDRQAEVLTLDLSGDRNNIDEEWILEVPESFAARVTMDVGKIRVSGIRGGCDARMDVGDVDVRIPEGSVSAENDVGDIRVHTDTGSYGNVDLRSDVGKVHVILDGHDVDRKRAPGAGDTLRLNGPGRDRIRAHTDVGSVNVRIR